MYRTLLVAAAVPIALGYSYDYADAPTAAPTRTFSPTTHEPTTSPFAADNDSIREVLPTRPPVPLPFLRPSLPFLPAPHPSLVVVLS